MTPETMSNEQLEWQENLPYVAQQSREVFARFGLAMYYAQCLEHQIGLDLASMYNQEFFETSPDGREVFYDCEFKKTLVTGGDSLVLGCSCIRLLNSQCARESWLSSVIEHQSSHATWGASRFTYNRTAYRRRR